MIIKNFKELSKTDVETAGGKGASLGEMTRAGIAVPPGFVILADAFETFIEKSAIAADIAAVLEQVKHTDPASIERASEKIQGIILSTRIPGDLETEIKQAFSKLGTKLVAVRSSATSEDSATAAWAGQLDTFLNTTEAQLLPNIRRCWASLFTPRAIFYRFEKKLQQQKISVAVVVQKMVQSEVSGIAFSVHPVTEDHNQMIIEAGFGLGEAIVSGQVTPDSYVVAKDSGEIIEKNVNAQNRELQRGQNGNIWRMVAANLQKVPKLSNVQISKLGKIILQIEKHYGFPCDIEWAYEKGKFYITQSRPITTLRNAADSVSEKKSNPPIFKFEKIYTRDTTYIMQELWAHGNSIGVEKEFGWKNPYLPGIIHYMNDGSIEIWENLKATQWLEDQILAVNKKDPRFIGRVLKTYQEKLEPIHRLWKRKKLPIRQLLKLIEASKAVLPYFIVYYYSAVDSRTPKNIRKKALAMRNKDEFFAENDMVIRDSITALYPHFRTFETSIFIDELKQPPSKKILEQRKKASLIVQGQQKFIGRLEDYAAIHQNFKFKKDFVKSKSAAEFSGEIAQKGKAIGVVKILRRRDQVHEVTAEHVIVSPMTTPDFLPAMQLAKAYVTDEGGITCHAGIVARELKKPCIIGTKIATEILHDGDLIEVDADRGVVRIIKRYSQELKLSKFMSREHSFFYAHIWNEANRDFFDKYVPGTNVRNMLFLRQSSGILEIYYDLNELEKISVKISAALIKSPKIFNKIISEFNLSWKKILPYVSEKKHIKTVAELGDYYKICVQWWAAMAYIFIIPDRKEFPKKLRDKALILRQQTQQYSDQIDRVYFDFVRNHYPELAKTAELLKPDEIAGGRVNSSVKKQIASRKKDWGLATINGKIYFGPKISILKELKSAGIAFNEPPALYSKIFTRDFCLAAIEVWYRGETIEPKHWTNQAQPYYPYIVFKRNYGTVACYYNLAGVEWIKNQLLELARKDKEFLPMLVKVIPKKLKFLQPIYEKQQSLDRKKLLRFIKELQSYYPWFEAMWWFMEMNERELQGLDIASLRKIRQQTNELSTGTDIVIRKSLEKLYPKFKDYVGVLSVKEIESGKLPAISELKKREQGFFFTDDKLFTDLQVSEFEHKYNITLEKHKSPDRQVLIQGQSAYRGKVRGLVRKIMGHKDVSKIKAGEILVTPMTMPNFLPAMHQAAAFVTDEGGITSHAAIVARELKKPCIIGTKIATEILHDGDLVEVDADRGVVRILADSGKALEKQIARHLKKSDYILSFRVSGVNLLITDISRDMFTELDALYIVQVRVYNQFFRVKKYQQALDQGLKFYSSPTAFKKFRSNFQKLFKNFESLHRHIIKNNNVKAADARKFLNQAVQLCTAYGKMNTEYTDKAYALRNRNKILIENLENLSKFKDQARVLMNKALFENKNYLEIFLKKLGKQFEIKPETLQNYTQKEILALFQSKTVAESDLAERLQAFVTLSINGKIEYYQGRPAQIIAERFLEKVNYDQKEFSGQTANSGKIRGSVKIIPVDYSDFSRINREIKKMQKGQILVAETTAPELILACKKAAAIVTDLGGLMSHAAIVSRELGIPCVVGTKIATKILKDGDLIEVDAARGLVKILKHAGTAEKRAN